MKRLWASICLILIMAMAFAPSCFAAAEDDASGAGAGAGFHLEASTPEDGEENVAVENLSVKLRFDTEMLPESRDIRKANAKEFRLEDHKGNQIPIEVYYSHKEEGLMMVVSDVIGKDIQIEGDTKYRLVIGADLQATDGTKLGEEIVLNFKTLDQAGSTMIYMIMMGVMIVGMVFFTSRATKKAAEKEREASGKQATVNPYKEAKRTGKSVEEIVAQDQKKKAKQAEALAKKKEEEEALLEEILAKEKAESNKRVSGPKPISAAGGTYKVKVVKTQPQQPKKGTTNPKNQTGKQRNSKNKGGGKKKKK